MPGPLPDVPAPPAGLEIRPARSYERRAWRMLLPEVAASLDPCRVLVALSPLKPDDVPRVIGAVAATEHHALVPRRGPRVLPHVPPPFRRRGVGRALVEAIAQHVLAAAPFERRDPEVLYAWTPLAEDDPHLPAWRALGFGGRVETVIHEVDASATEAALRPIAERLRPRVPADARVVRLADATPAQVEQVAALHVRHLGGRPQEMRELIGGPTPRYRPESPVLLRGDRVVGFSLSREMPDVGVLMIEANVLEPDHRGGWANVLLKYAEARNAIEAGFAKGHFQTFSHHTDTRRFARRMGDTIARRLSLLYRPLRAEPE